MRHTKKMAITMVAGAGLLLGGCLGGQGGSAQAEEGAPMAGQTRTAASGGTTLAELYPELLAEGRLQYGENCQGCHQDEGRGLPGTAPSITNPELLRAASDEFLLKTITYGREETPMIAFGEFLSDEQIKAIIVYLRSFSHDANISAQIDADRQAMGDPRLGKRWFEQVCAGCHGPRGEGYEGSGSGTAIGRSGFLNTASDGFIRYIIKNGRSNTPMRGFTGAFGLANLTDQEIDDIISYLRVIQ